MKFFRNGGPFGVDVITGDLPFTGLGTAGSCSFSFSKGKCFKLKFFLGESEENRRVGSFNWILTGTEHCINNYQVMSQRYNSHGLTYRMFHIEALKRIWDQNFLIRKYSSKRHRKKRIKDERLLFDSFRICLDHAKNSVKLEELKIVNEDSEKIVIFWLV
jgi:hypothetical protein